MGIKSLKSYARAINESAGNVDVVMYGETGGTIREIKAWMKETPITELLSYDVYFSSCPAGRDEWGIEDALQSCDTVVIWLDVPSQLWENLISGTEGTVYDAIKALGEPETCLLKSKWNIR